MSKEEEFLDALKGIPLKEAKAIDKFRKRIELHDNIGRVEFCSNGVETEYYRASIVLPVSLPSEFNLYGSDKFSRGAFRALDSVLGKSSKLEVEIDEEIVLYVEVPTNIGDYTSVEGFVEDMQLLLDVADNERKYSNQVMHDPDVQEVFSKYKIATDN